MANERADPIRVVLADDHELLRGELRAELEASGFVVCGEAGDAAGALAAAERELPDVCVLDVRMPGDGLVAAGDIALRLPAVSVVMLTAIGDEETALAARQAGARGVLSKDLDGARLAAALRRVVAGEPVWPEPNAAPAPAHEC